MRGKLERSFQGGLNVSKFNLVSIRRNGLCSDKASDGVGLPALACSELPVGKVSPLMGWDCLPRHVVSFLWVRFSRWDHTFARLLLTAFRDGGGG